jgi:High potential iron-sulfur protein
MMHAFDESRRRLLKRITLGAALLPLALRRSQAANAPLVTEDDPTAKPGSHCGNCQLYQGTAGSAQGGCQLFPGKQVKSAGWCSSWTPKSS